MRLPLLALAVCAFAIGTTEFVINGLQTHIAADLGVSIPAAGLLVSGFAVGIIVGAPLLTVLGLRVRRRTVLLAAMVLFAGANVLVALAPTYPALMVGRVLSGVAVGGFYGVGAVVAPSLVPPDRQARAIALMFAGATAGTTLGVPLGTLVGQAAGWRTTFGAVAVLGALGVVALAVLLPATRTEERRDLRAELAALRRPQVLLALAVTAASFGAITATYAYIEPLLRYVSGFSDGAVTLVLLLLGAGLLAGNVVGGRAADRAVLPTLGKAFAALAVAQLVFGLLAEYQAFAAVMAFLFGAAGYALVPAAQLRVVATAADAPTLASATNISAFNVGVALGGWAAGEGLAAGLGWPSVTWVGAGFALTGLALVFASAALDRRGSSGPARSVPATRQSNTWPSPASGS